MRGVKYILCATLISLYGYSVAASSCKPGSVETFRNGCSTCYCSKMGKWACKPSEEPQCAQIPKLSNMKVKRDSIPANDLYKTPCAPTDFFVLDCNTCYCNGKGTGYLCSDKICPANPPSPTVETSSVSTTTGKITEIPTSSSGDKVEEETPKTPAAPSTTEKLIAKTSEENSQVSSSPAPTSAPTPAPTPPAPSSSLPPTELSSTKSSATEVSPSEEASKAKD